MLTTALRNTLLNELAVITSVSLHSAYSVDGTAHELTGGSPAYARKAVAFGAALDASVTATFTAAFDVPAGATVAWFGLWSTSEFAGMLPNGGSTPVLPRPFVSDDTATDILRSVRHGLTTGERLVVWAGGHLMPIFAGGSSGLTEGTIYYADYVSDDSFKLSTISGGVTLDLATHGQGFWQPIRPAFFAAQGTFRLDGLTFMVPRV